MSGGLSGKEFGMGVQMPAVQDYKSLCSGCDYWATLVNRHNRDTETAYEQFIL